jgi:hypothetical protein
VTAIEDAGIVTIPRDDFVSTFWDPLPGEHVTIVAPTGWGKSHLAFQLLDPVCTDQAPGVVLQMKARDDTVTDFRKRAKFKVIRDWPPPPRVPGVSMPRGYIVAPPVTFDPDIDHEVHWRAFRATMIGAMKRGKGIKVFADESADLQDINLGKTMDNFLRQARSLKAGFWSATQRPFNAPMLSYGQATHLLLGNDSDRRSRQRLSEIGGIADSKMVERVTLELPQYHFLYIRKPRAGSGTVMCVVAA